jgi:RNA polymerase sigma factor (sigma-70 family)
MNTIVIKQTPIQMLQEQNRVIEQKLAEERTRLLDFIRKNIPNRDDAEDVLQDVFYQFTETTRSLIPIEKVSNWLFTVARNKITDRYRKKKPELLDSIKTGLGSDEGGEPLFLTDILPAENDSPETRNLRKLIVSKLQESLLELPAEQRDVFVKHELEDKTFKEIAEETGVQVNTLLSRKRYAVQLLQKRLRSLYEQLND